MKMVVTLRYRLCLLIITASVSIACFTLTGLAPSVTSVEFVSVGQADCSFVRTAGGRNILIDTGRYSKTGSSDISRFLTKRGIRNLDVVIISHYHDDHYGGLLDIIGKKNISLILLPIPQIREEEILLSYIASNVRDSTKIAFFRTGESVDIGEHISLTPILANDAVDDANDRGLVIMMQCFDRKFLFTGDITSEAEEKILSLYSDEYLDVDVLKTAHHGSRYSSSEEFCKAVSPEYSVISVGTNSYGHPSAEVLERLSACSEVLRTDSNGNITFYIDENSFRVSTAR